MEYCTSFVERNSVPFGINKLLYRVYNRSRIMDAESLIQRGINIFLHGLTNAALTRGIANLFAAIKTLLLTLELLPLRASLAHIFVNLLVLYNKL